MEATGSYWKPVWYVLEERAFELRLVNAHHVKILPGRKSDVLDAEWLAELLEHGLLRASFVPPTGDPRAARPDPLPQAADPGAPRRTGQGSVGAGRPRSLRLWSRRLGPAGGVVQTGRGPRRGAWERRSTRPG